MQKSRLLAWGTNSHGQLGLNFKSEQSTLPQEINLSTLNLDPKNIKKIVGGGGHTLILDNSGKLYSCGRNDNFQTGHAIENPMVLKFRKIDKLENERINDVSCGWDGSMGVTETGRIFVWGSNRYGQLGESNKCGDENFERICEPRTVLGLDEGIKGLAMGLRHSALVTTTGRVLVAGSGSNRQLGVLDSDGSPLNHLNTFEPIPDLTDVVAIACGQNHTVAVKNTGEIYTWGDNKHGQCGFDNKKFKNIATPKKLFPTEMGDIKEVRAGWTHTSFLNADGIIFSCGRNTYGQLGYREDENNANWMIGRLRIGSKIRQLSVGSEHNVALTDDGTVLSWGWNEHGNCGNGNTTDVLVPEKVEVLPETKAILVGGGAGHSFAVLTDNV